MTDYKHATTRNMPGSRRPTTEPAAPELTRAAAMRRQRDRYGAMSRSGMNAAEMCRAMSTEELEANARRGGSAAIAEEAYRAGNVVMPDPDLDLGV